MISRRKLMVGVAAVAASPVVALMPAAPDPALFFRGIPVHFDPYPDPPKYFITSTDMLGLIEDELRLRERGGLIFDVHDRLA